MNKPHPAEQYTYLQTVTLAEKPIVKLGGHEELSTIMVELDQEQEDDLANIPTLTTKVSQ